MKKFLVTLLFFLSLFVVAALHIAMDDVKDLYLSEVVSKKAHPVKISSNKGIIGSSWQVKYNNKRLTVTNNHVCSVIKQINETRLKHNKLQPDLIIGDEAKRILYISKDHDICFLEPKGDVYFSLASSVRRGEKVTIIGHPRGIEEQSLTDGRIIGDREEEYRWLPKAGKIRVLLSTAIAYPGNSGSPVVNRYGNVIGILFGGIPITYINVNLIVPLNIIESELKKFTEAKNKTNITTKPIK